MSWWASPRLQVRPAPANEVTKTNTPVNFFEPFFTLTNGPSESASNGPDYTDLVFDNPDLNALNLMSTHTACTYMIPGTTCTAFVFR